MAITAARLGSSPLRVDWSGLASVPAGGPGTSSFGGKPDGAHLTTLWRGLKGRFESGEIGFYDTPVNPALSAIQSVQDFAASPGFTNPAITDCLFLGIGGSALGPLSLLSALKPRPRGAGLPALRFHFQENVDPEEWRSTLSELRPESTLVCIVTKSGATYETIAQAILALEWLGRERWRTQVVAITDPKNGELRRFAEQHAIPSLPIAPSIGGRFSVFSPVGLVPARLAGLDVDAFLTGARQVRDHVEKAPPEKNPLFILAHDFVRHSAKRPVHVCMPYSTRLRAVGDWWVQLWAESLGKDGKGFTAVAALGATDQHSMLQLLRDGPDDKITWFVSLEERADPVPVPRLSVRAGDEVPPTFKLLEGQSLDGLLKIEHNATSRVLSQRNRPQISFQLDRLDERGLGSLYFAFSVLTTMTGAAMGVDPFDQPGVQEAKNYIQASLESAARGHVDSSAASDRDDSNSAYARLRQYASRPSETFSGVPTTDDGNGIGGRSSDD